MPLNCDSMDNSLRFGRLNIGITAPKGFNKKTDKDQYSMQVIFKDTPEEQDAVYINGKKLGTLPQLRGATNLYRADRMLGSLSQNEIKVNTATADPIPAFPTTFKGFTGLIKSAFAKSPTMTVKELWDARKPEVLTRAYLGSMAHAMGFDRVVTEDSVSFDALNAKQMDGQRQDILSKSLNGEFFTLI